MDGDFILKGCITLIVTVLLSGILTMVLWNWLMPGLFELPTINLWQGWGLAALGSCLFGGTKIDTK